MEPNELLDPMECQWCDAVYERGSGGSIGGDNVCGDCIDYNESIE